MRKQLTSIGGRSFWNLKGIPWNELVCGKPHYSDDPWVKWQGRTWLRKRKDETISEIVGYQIAENLGIPVQPWAAFFDLTIKGGIGILVEQWPLFNREVALWSPVKRHADLAARGLALAVLDRHEWPSWLVSADDQDLRLFDLECIGPFLCQPLSDTRIVDYRNASKACLSYAQRKASEAGVSELFVKHLAKLVQMDFSNILDFSGHPNADRMKNVIVQALKARQQELRRIARLK